jgi:hypothetical protein
VCAACGDVGQGCCPGDVCQPGRTCNRATDSCQ